MKRWEAYIEKYRKQIEDFALTGKCVDKTIGCNDCPVFIRTGGNCPVFDTYYDPSKEALEKCIKILNEEVDG